MGARRTQRRLTHVAARLRTLREELAVADEQLEHLRDDAEDLELRALVSDTPSFESRDARGHVDAMRRHRDHVLTEIAQLERRQDELLDEMTG